MRADMLNHTNYETIFWELSKLFIYIIITILKLMQNGLLLLVYGIEPIVFNLLTSFRFRCS